MNQGKYIFAQLTDFLPRRVFDRLVEKHQEIKNQNAYLLESDAVHDLRATDWSGQYA